MTQVLTKARERLIQDLEQMVRERLPADRTENAACFIRHYYTRLGLELLEERDPLDLYGAALTQLNLARRRTPNQTLLRVYNPTIEQDGWECPHSVVEIVIEDMPFLVDSVQMALHGLGLKILRIMHPIFSLRRDDTGQLLEILDREPPRAEHQKPISRESIMHLEIMRQTDPTRLRETATTLDRVLEDVRRAVRDWQAMLEVLADKVAEIEAAPPPLDPARVAESLAFLRWLNDENFTFLGYRQYELTEQAGREHLKIVSDSGLGILRERPGIEESRAFANLPPELQSRAHEAQLLILTKANARATVHRPVNLDYVGIKRFDAAGRVCGEDRFLGLYGSRAYHRLPQEIPILRRKIAYVVQRAALEPNSHSAKALAHVLDSYPRDELFQIRQEELFEIAMGIMQMAEEQRPRLFIRQDTFCRFVTCLVFAPRDRYDTQVRQRMQRILQEAFNGTQVEFTVKLSESPQARILFTVRTRPGEIPEYDSHEIEDRLVETIHSWSDHLQTALLEQLGEERGHALYQVYADAFPAGYREDFSARPAVRDIEHMERLDSENELAMSLYSALEAAPGQLRFKVFRFGRPLPLSQALPILENMGVQVEEERPYRIDRRDSPPLWIHDFGLTYAGWESPLSRELRDLFQDAFAMVWQGRMEDDGFNQLVVKARLDWRRVALLRAYAKYLRQTGIAFSQAYMEQAIAANPPIAGLLVRLFERRFDPMHQGDNAAPADGLVEQLHEALDAVQSLDQDRILRSLLALIQATLRSNWFQLGEHGEHKSHIALKLHPAQIPGLPEPRPAFEIFVYSPRMEGVHLRGGKVARGGLRWSDRREDFRTEVLGLMKAQMVKNALIVPVGAKGGFVVKRPGSDRESLQREAVFCYRQFVSGLLDLTDNRLGNACVPPAELVRYDADDPYLVVAADKGTASLSDTANELAAAYGFWLGDAFASGGTSGYDHKRMGITARGAWECVKQHFQAAGIDYLQHPFSVIGIGDMSGDVFGNGMLLSRQIKLVAAFDHRHLFIDPDPHPETSFEERQRLFELPGSSWADYNPKLISEGGGVYPRTLKSIQLSESARSMLGTARERMTPNELIRSILQAPVDLLWNGGIGTYVRAGTERDGDVGDRSNDAVRVSAGELGCRIVGEGGNLGLTQLARIEFARRGGRLDTDFIHNAGGVSCSDHEVNIKILLDQVVADGDLTLKQRNRLLQEMTEEVAQLVLQDCYWQNRAIGLDAYRARDLLLEQARLIRSLEQQGRIDRALEHLPDDEALVERQAEGIGLTRPEIALLISYAKHTLYEDLLASDLPENPCLAVELEHYFPTPLREDFRERIHAHRLRREILCSSVANRLINRMGSTFIFRLQEDLDVAAAVAVRAAHVAWEVLEMRRLWSGVAALDGRVDDTLQQQMLSSGVRLVARSCRWLLKNSEVAQDIAGTIERYRQGIAQLSSHLPELVQSAHAEALQAQASGLQEAGAPAELARWVAGFDTLSRAFDIVEVAEACRRQVSEAARGYFLLGADLELDWLASKIAALPTRDRWLVGARVALRDELLEHHRTLCIDLLLAEPIEGTAEARLAGWKQRNQTALEAWLRLLAELKTHAESQVAMLSVALQSIRKLVRAASAK